MAKKRKLENWLKGLLELVEDTEAPRNYWFWGGLFTIASALQRKVWIPYGLENIYPNLYVILVAQPGGRKGGPLGIAKRMLEEIFVPTSVDSGSKRALTQELAATAETEQFMHPDGKPRRMSTLAIVSKEFGSLLAVDKENMIITLTDLYDSADTWKYKTSGQGNDFLYNVCVSCFCATTPKWLSDNLPPGAFGGGFASRVAWIAEGSIYRPVPWPKEPDKILYKALVQDLNTIYGLIGEFQITPTAKAVFDAWYERFPLRMRNLRDERLTGSLNRLHILALKVAMGLRVAHSNELLIDENEMGQATDLVDSMLATAGEAFGGVGLSHFGPLVEKVRSQLRTLKELPMNELMSMNYKDMSLVELEEILKTLETMGEIERPFSSKGSLNQAVRWIKKREL